MTNKNDCILMQSDSKSIYNDRVLFDLHKLYTDITASRFCSPIFREKIETAILARKIVLERRSIEDADQKASITGDLTGELVAFRASLKKGA